MSQLMNKVQLQYFGASFQSVNLEVMLLRTEPRNHSFSKPTQLLQDSKEGSVMTSELLMPILPVVIYYLSAVLYHSCVKMKRELCNLVKLKLANDKKTYSLKFI